MASAPANLKGRVAVVTGATSGIGRGVALALARRRATVVLVGRTETRCVAAAAAIAAESENSEVYPIPITDLALKSEVGRIATLLTERYPRIHLLVNNAGGYFHRRELTAEGLERTFALNVLAPFLLTARLLPRLLESSPSRILFLASEAHRGNTLDFGNLQGEHGYRGYRNYGRSKLADILLAREFARRLHDHPVTVNAVHPGIVASGFGRNNAGLVGYGVGLAMRLFGRSVASAAEDIVFDGTDPSLEHVTGAYLAHRDVRAGTAASQDMVTALRLYETCAELAKPSL